MTAAWPATLPQQFLRDGFEGTSADNIIASSVSTGPAKTRRRTTAAVRPLSGTMIMTSAQLATFRAFVSTTIAERSRPFTFPDPYGGSDLLVRMVEPFKDAPNVLDWRVTITLEVLP